MEFGEPKRKDPEDSASADHKLKDRKREEDGEKQAKQPGRRAVLRAGLAVGVGSVLGQAACKGSKEKTHTKPEPCPPCETKVEARPAEKASGAVKAKTFASWEIEKPAKVFFASVGKGASLAVWAAKVEELFKKLQPESLLGKTKLIAVKQHFGEKGNKHHIKPKLTGKVLSELKRLQAKPCLVETNTLYKGSRSNTYDHMITADAHGFSLAKLGAPVVILDGLNGQNQQAIAIPGKHFKVVFVASDAFFFDSMVALSHVKGHKLSGFGGAVKNIAMGLASRAGKLAQHADFTPHIDGKKCTNCGTCAVWCPPEALQMKSGKLHFDQKMCIGCGQCLTVCPENAIENRSSRSTQATFMEKMAEYALGGAAAVNGRMICINVVNNVSKLCDCARGENPIVASDVGVFASKDPVAVDAASLDVSVKKWGKDPFAKLYPEVEAKVTLEHAQKIGLGTMSYELVEV
jgi:hypothetical protein